MSKESTSNEIGFFGLLGVAFIVLKLTGFIDWSWWWVTLPIWGGIAIAILILIIALIYALVTTKKENVEKKNV